MTNSAPAPPASPARATLLDHLAGELVTRGRGLAHPLRVGIDGPQGVGKTRFAHDLTTALRRAAAPVIDLDSDGFHHVRARRHRNTTDPARGYYEDAYDFESVAEQVLHPLGDGGTLRYATTVHDLATDAVITNAQEIADPETILLFAATFIQRAPLQGLWDEVIYLDASRDVARDRGVARDSQALGGTDEALRAYNARYHAAWQIYVDEVGPRERAGLVIEHTDPAQPRLVRA